MGADKFNFQAVRLLGRKQYQYTFKDSLELVEEYDGETGLLLRTPTSNCSCYLFNLP